MFLLYIGLYAILFFPLLNYSRFTQDEDPAELIYLLYQGAFGFWIVLGSIWVHEQVESKNNSYNFLRALPIRNKDIITAKFALVLFSVLFFVIYQTGAIALLVHNADYSLTAWKFNTFIGNLCLLLGGIVYMGIYRFGFLRIGKVVLIIWLLLFLSPILLREFIMPNTNLSVETLVDQVTSMNWLVLTAIVLAIFWGMLQMSIHIKNSENREKK